MAKGFGQYIRSGESPRVAELRKKIKRLTDPESLMLEILDVFREAEFIPKIGRYYTFVYIPKTKNLRFDQFPLIVCLDIQKWGFKGYNYHWNEVRNYTWIEVAGKLHIIRDNEIEYLKTIPYARFLTK